MVDNIRRSLGPNQAKIGNTTYSSPAKQAEDIGNLLATEPKFRAQMNTVKKYQQDSNTGLLDPHKYADEVVLGGKFGDRLRALGITSGAQLVKYAEEYMSSGASPSGWSSEGPGTAQIGDRTYLSPTEQIRVIGELMSTNGVFRKLMDVVLERQQSGSTGLLDPNVFANDKIINNPSLRPILEGLGITDGAQLVNFAKTKSAAGRWKLP